ncbi:uncharacterized [Tachysurus ichikawai]
MVRNLSSALLFPVHPLPCYAIRHSSNLLPTQPSKALLLLDLSSIQLSHYAINTNSVIWAIRRLQSTNQPSNARDLKQAERLKAPGNLTETLGALGSTAIFTIHFGGREEWAGGVGRME